MNYTKYKLNNSDKNHLFPKDLFKCKGLCAIIRNNRGSPAASTRKLLHYYLYHKEDVIEFQNIF